MASSILSDLLLIIVAAFFGGFAARTFKLPPVLGYIASGVVFGIIGQNIFYSYNSLVTFSEVGVALLLFTLGFEISIDRLLATNRKILLVGLLQVILGTIFMVPLLLLFGVGFQVSLLLGTLFSFSSTAVVVKILEENGLISDFPGNNVFILLLIQDILVIPIIFLMPVIFKGDFSALSIIDLAISSAKPLAILSVIIIASRLFLSRILNLVFRYPSHELTILATIFTASLSILLLTMVGLPSSIAAFFAGVLISEQGKNLAPLSEIRPFRDIFLVLFFVMTGMLLNFNFFTENILLIVSLSLCIILLKFSVSYILLKLFSFSTGASVFISSYISNVGEFAIVLGQIALISKILPQREYNLLLSVFILTLISIPLIVKAVRIISGRMVGFKLGKHSMAADLQHGMNLADNNKIHNHVVICGHGRVGRHVRALLEMAGIEYLVVDYNKKVINELISSSRNAIYGDPSDPEILKASFIENAKVLVIAVPDFFTQRRVIDTALKLNPKIVIMCRSHKDEDHYDLINMGVNTIIMPEFEAGLRIGSEVLDIFQVNDPDISSFVKRVRRENRT